MQGREIRPDEQNRETMRAYKGANAANKSETKKFTEEGKCKQKNNKKELITKETVDGHKRARQLTQGAQGG